MQVAATEGLFPRRRLGCTFLLESSSPLVPEHLQHGRTSALVSSWLAVLPWAAAGLLCAPFTSDDIPIVLPRSPFWLTHSGPKRGISRSKSSNVNISFFFVFFFLLFFYFIFYFFLCVCVCVNPLKTGWPDPAQPGSAQLR